jgi:hypothetical protein
MPVLITAATTWLSTLRTIKLWRTKSSNPSSRNFRTAAPSVRATDSAVYARKAKVILPALEEFETRPAELSVLVLGKAASGYRTGTWAFVVASRRVCRNASCAGWRHE